MTPSSFRKLAIVHLVVDVLSGCSMQVGNASLIPRIMVWSIQGSTVVMTAISNNDLKQFQKAIDCAPSCGRAQHHH